MTNFLGREVRNVLAHERDHCRLLLAHATLDNPKVWISEREAIVVFTKTTSRHMSEPDSLDARQQSLLRNLVRHLLSVTVHVLRGRRVSILPPEVLHHILLILTGTATNECDLHFIYNRVRGLESSARTTYLPGAAWPRCRERWVRSLRGRVAVGRARCSRNPPPPRCPPHRRHPRRPLLNRNKGSNPLLNTPCNSV